MTTLSVDGTGHVLGPLLGPPQRTRTPLPSDLGRVVVSPSRFVLTVTRSRRVPVLSVSGRVQGRPPSDFDVVRVTETQNFPLLVVRRLIRTSLGRRTTPWTRPEFVDFSGVFVYGLSPHRVGVRIGPFLSMFVLVQSYLHTSLRPERGDSLTGPQTEVRTGNSKFSVLLDWDLIVHKSVPPLCPKPFKSPREILLTPLFPLLLVSPEESPLLEVRPRTSHSSDSSVSSVSPTRSVCHDIFGSVPPSFIIVREVLDVHDRHFVCSSILFLLLRALQQSPVSKQ